MRYIKMLGLAAIAAAALTAILGAGTASATTLCQSSTTETPCSAANTVKTGTVITYTAENSVKLTGPFSLNIDTCTESTVEGKTANETGATVVGNIQKLTFGKCTRPIDMKNTEGNETLGTLSIAWVKNDQGAVTSNDTTVTITEVPGFGTCHYKTENTPIGTLTGKNEAANGISTFDINASIKSENGSRPECGPEITSIQARQISTSRTEDNPRSVVRESIGRSGHGAAYCSLAERASTLTEPPGTSNVGVADAAGAPAGAALRGRGNDEDRIDQRNDDCVRARTADGGSGGGALAGCSGKPHLRPCTFVDRRSLRAGMS